MQFLAVIPAFNEEDFIYSVVSDVKNVVNDVVVIDDGSRDKTAIKAKRANALVLSHQKNIGKGMALRTGFAYAIKNGFDAVITIDGDGQHSGKDVARIISCARTTNADLVIGVRPMRLREMPFIRLATNIASSAFVSFLVRKKLSDVHSGARFISAKVLKNIRITSTKFDIEIEMLLKALNHGFSIAQAEIGAIYGKEKSDINPLLDAFRYFKTLSNWGLNCLD